MGGRNRSLVHGQSAPQLYHRELDGEEGLDSTAAEAAAAAAAFSALGLHDDLDGSNGEGTEGDMMVRSGIDGLLDDEEDYALGMAEGEEALMTSPAMRGQPKEEVVYVTLPPLDDEWVLDDLSPEAQGESACCAVWEGMPC
jgi:hypothetical protein